MEENAYRISVDFTPWNEKGCMVVSLHLFECLGGEIANGDMELNCPDIDEALELITEEQTGNIIIKDNNDDGLKYEVPIFIESRRYFENILNISFTCISDKSFYTDRISLEHADINDALDSLYPGKKDIRTKSDLNNNIPIYQTDETNYSLCERLAYSFKKDTIFAFGMEGFMLKDTIGTNSLGEDEKSYELVFLGMGDMDNTDMYNLTYDKILNTEPFNPWEDKDKDLSTTKEDYTDLEFKNCRALINYTTYNIVGKDYYDLQETYNYNYNLMNSNYYTSFEITGEYIPQYKIGDVLTYKRANQKVNYPFTKFIVASNEFYFSQNGASRRGPHGKQYEWTTGLLGIEPGKWSEETKNDGKLL